MTRMGVRNAALTPRHFFLIFHQNLNSNSDIFENIEKKEELEMFQQGYEQRETADVPETYAELTLYLKDMHFFRIMQ